MVHSFTLAAPLVGCGDWLGRGDNHRRNHNDHKNLRLFFPHEDFRRKSFFSKDLRGDCPHALGASIFDCQIE
jgi:hypothetical protein